VVRRCRGADPAVSGISGAENMSILKQIKGMNEKEAEAFLQAMLATKQNIPMKVSKKGGLSLYGIQRFPVTYYHAQWTRILDKADEIRAFIAANRAVKPDGKDKDGNAVKTYLVDKDED